MYVCVCVYIYMYTYSRMNYCGRDSLFLSLPSLPPLPVSLGEPLLLHSPHPHAAAPGGAASKRAQASAYCLLIFI